MRVQIPASEICAFKHRLVLAGDALTIDRVDRKRDKVLIHCDNLTVMRMPTSVITVELIGDPDDPHPIQSAVQSRVDRRAASPPRSRRHRRRDGVTSR